MERPDPLFAPEAPPVAEAVSELKVGWSYTAIEEPNYYTYAAGTTVGHKWYSNLLNDGWQVTDAKVYEKTRNTRRTKWRLDTDSTIPTRNELGQPSNGKNGMQFTVNLTKSAYTGTTTRSTNTKRLKIILEKDGDTRIVHDALFKVVPLKTIILAIDGFAYDSAIKTIEQGPNFNRVFGNRVQHVKPALSALPTITWANWPGVFSGQPPRETGWLGNSYFPRETSTGFLSLPVFSAAEPSLDKAQQIGVALGGKSFDVLVPNAYPMRTRSLSTADSLYDTIANSLGKTSSNQLNVRSVRVFYDKAGDAVDMDSTFFSRLDPLGEALFSPVDPHGHGEEAAATLDNGFEQILLPLPVPMPVNVTVGTGPQSVLAWKWNKVDMDIMSLYFPGPDNIGHGLGNTKDNGDQNYTLGEVTNPVNTILKHAKQHTDAALGSLMSQIESDGYQNAILFAMTADHGLHQFSRYKENASLEEKIKDRVIFTEELEPLFEDPDGLNMRLWRGDEQLGLGLLVLKSKLEQSNIVYSPNGGLAQVYIRSDNRTWQQPPTTDDIKKVASLLYREAVGHAGYNSSHIQDPRITTIPPTLYEELAPVTLGLPDELTDGVFGSPPAIFVRYDETGFLNNFEQNYRWLKQVTPNPAGTNDPSDYLGVELGSIEDFIQARKDVLQQQGITDFNWPEFEKRLDEMNHKNPSGSRSGDVVMIMDGRNGYLTVNLESDAFDGWHGGPTISESNVPLMFSMPGTAFVDSDGNPINAPPQLLNGFTSGVESTGISPDSQLRNWHLTPILEEIITQFRNE